MSTAMRLAQSVKIRESARARSQTTSLSEPGGRVPHFPSSGTRDVIGSQLFDGEQYLLLQDAQSLDQTPIYCPQQPLFVDDDLDIIPTAQEHEKTPEPSADVLFAGSLNVVSIPMTALASDQQDSAAISRTRIFSHALLVARNTGQVGATGMFLAHGELRRDGHIVLFWSETDRTVICSVPLSGCSFNIVGESNSTMAIVTTDGQHFEFGTESATVAAQWLVEITKAAELTNAQAKQNKRRHKRLTRVHTLYRHRRREPRSTKPGPTTAEHRTLPTKLNASARSASPSTSSSSISSSSSSRNSSRSSAFPSSSSSISLNNSASPSSLKTARKDWLQAMPTRRSETTSSLLSAHHQQRQPSAVDSGSTRATSLDDRSSGGFGLVNGAVGLITDDGRGSTPPPTSASVDSSVFDPEEFSDEKVNRRMIVSRSAVGHPPSRRGARRSLMVQTGARLSKAGSQIMKKNAKEQELPASAVLRYQAASVNSLIQALWSEDEEFARVMLFTHPTFVSSRALWTLMRTQFNEIYPYGERNDLDVVDLVLHNRIRIIGIIHLWIEMGLLPTNIEQEVIALIDKFGPVTLNLLPAITRELIGWCNRQKAKRMHDLHKESTSSVIKVHYATAERSDDASSDTITDSTSFDGAAGGIGAQVAAAVEPRFDPMTLFFKAFSTTTSAETFAKDQLSMMSPEELARCCCVAEFSAFSAIPPLEFLAFVEDKALAPTLNRFVELFNLRSRWMAAQILLQQSISHQLALIAKLAKAADICRAHNNFSSVLMLTSAIYCPQVYSLFALLRQLPRDIKIMLRALGELMSPENGYKRYRLALKAVKKPPCVPYIGTILRQLISVDECHSDTIDGSVHFTKRLYFYTTVQDIFKFRSTPFPFTDLVKETTPIFLEFFENPVSISEHDLDKLSAEVAGSLPQPTDQQ